jgi:small subunit ribosomal protein S1
MTDVAAGNEQDRPPQDAESAQPETGNEPSVTADAPAGENKATAAVPESDRPSTRIQVGSRRQPTAAGGEPAAAEPSTSESVADDAIAGEPAAAEPGTSEPVADAAEAKPAEPSTDEPAPAEPIPVAPVGPVPTPSVRDELPEDLEQEIAAALGDASLDQLMTDATPGGVQQLEGGSRIQAVVIRADGEHLFLSLGGTNEGLLPLRQIEQVPQPNDQIEVTVRSYNIDDGLYELAIPGAAIDVEDWSDLKQGVVVEARITGANTGGLECMVNKIRGFIPSSQIGLFRVEEFGEYIGQKLSCVVNEVNRRKKNLVLSHRAILERETDEKRKAVLEAITVGTTVEGIVRSVRDFGAFVDIGGIDGLVHVSQLSWDRVDHPSDVVKEGDKVKVKIEKVDRQSGKISLSCRALQEHPWTSIASKFTVGEIVTGTVTRLAAFGAFVRLAPAVEGLIHVSELAHHHVSQVESVVKQDEEVQVKILSIDAEAQRIGLSIKQLQEAPQRDNRKADDGADDEPLRDPVVKPTNKPLKGGTNKSAGGDQFGLNW